MSCAPQGDDEDGSDVDGDDAEAGGGGVLEKYSGVKVRLVFLCSRAAPWFFRCSSTTTLRHIERDILLDLCSQHSRAPMLAAGAASNRVAVMLDQTQDSSPSSL